MKTTISYTANIVLLGIIAVMFYYNSNNNVETSNVEYSKEMKNTLKNKKAFAAIAITQDKNIVFTGPDGKPGNLCTFNTQAKSKLPLCRGADKIEKVTTATIIFSKGSICGASSNSSGGYRQLCWP